MCGLVGVVVGKGAGVCLYLFALGELSAHSVKKFGAGAQHFKNIEDLMAVVESALAPNVTLLIKGSRFMQMDRIVRKFELELFDI